MTSKRFAIFLLLLLFASPFGAQAATVRDLSGTVGLNYGEFTAEEGGVEVDDVSFFTQRYSILSKLKGEFRGGRAGHYDLALGGEWTALDHEHNGSDTDFDTGKVLFRGDVLFAPGGLPLRLRLFSRDMRPTGFMPGSSGRVAKILSGNNLVSNISNGQHISSGATLQLGIKNGSYLGKYRESLSKFPRTVVDYQEDVVKDLSSLTPQHYRLRNLAFISLNKKDNWIHYRVTDFHDFINSTENYTEKEYMLGTVDPSYQRNWINLTNWIQVSADISFNQRDEQDDNFKETASVNLFSKFERPTWRGSNFTNFNRTRQQSQLSKGLEVPLHLKGELSRDTSWRFGFVGSQHRSEVFVAGEDRIRDDAFASARIETMRQSRYVLIPKVEVETKGGNEGEGYGGRLGVELLSNRKFQPKYDFIGSYSLLRMDGTGIDGTTDVHFWEHEFIANVQARIGARIRTGLQEELVYGTGALDSSMLDHITPASSQNLSGSGGASSISQGDALRSTTTWFGEYTRSDRFNTRLDIGYEYLSVESEKEDKLTVQHSLRYAQRRYRLNVANELVFGVQQASGFNFDNISGGVSGGAVDFTFHHRSSFDYSPARTWEGGLSLEYDHSDGDGGATSLLDVNQYFRYSFFKTRGVSRKLAELGQELKFERLKVLGNPARSVTSFGLRGDYFPTRTILFGGHIDYEYFDPENYDTVVFGVRAGLNFEKLKVSLDYNHGVRSSSLSLLEREEDSWQVTVTKTF